MHDQVSAIVSDNVTMVVGLHFSGPEDSWEEIVAEWGEDILQKSRNAGIDVEADNFTLLHIKMPCGEILTAKTVADVPRKTVPCPCGDPGRYLVMYMDPGEVHAKANELALLSGVVINTIAEAAGRVKREAT